MKTFRKLTSLVLIALMVTVFVVPNTAQAAPKVTVSMANSGASILKGNQVRVKAKLKNAKIKKVTYKSSNKAIATVSKSGYVTGKTAGTVKITATVKATNKKTYRKTVKVYVKNTVTSKTPYLTFSGVNVVDPKKSVTLKSVVKNTKSPARKVSLTSSNTSIATMSSGTVKGIKSGTVTIYGTVTLANGHVIKGSCQVRVKTWVEGHYETKTEQKTRTIDNWVNEGHYEDIVETVSVWITSDGKRFYDVNELTAYCYNMLVNHGISISDSVDTETKVIGQKWVSEMVNHPKTETYTETRQVWIPGYYK